MTALAYWHHVDLVRRGRHVPVGRDGHCSPALATSDAGRERSRLPFGHEYHRQLSMPDGVLTLSGTDSVANYQRALRSVTYTNTADYNNPSATLETT